MDKNIVVIPARGGSKGIPRKNLRPLAGKPMIFYGISACAESENVDRIVVSTDDEEIALFSERFGADVIYRPSQLSDDLTTLDPVIAHAVTEAERKFDESYKFIVTVQPTSPLISSNDVDSALLMLASDNSLDSVLTVTEDRHLCWGVDNGKPKAAYKERVNRQSLPENYRETGAVIACTREQLDRHSRIGSNVGLLEVPQMRSFDIDTLADFWLCESILKHKRIVFTVVGYPAVGLGHAFRSVMLAHELIHYDIVFLCEKKSQLAIDYIESFNYSVIKCEDDRLGEALIDIAPDLVVNDILDTEEKYISLLKESGMKVVNFEDLGSGIKSADLVVNALYPNKLPFDHVKVGPEYFCLRDEFIFTPKLQRNKPKQDLLITFGGVDEGNLSYRVASLILPWAVDSGIKVTMVLGPGYGHAESIMSLEMTYSNRETFEVVRSTSRISDYMANADLAITSGGRTVLELAALEVPMVVICQNEREETHSFASEENGIINLGFREKVIDPDIESAVKSLFEDSNLYAEMKSKLSLFDLSKGKKRVCEMIKNVLEAH